MKSRFGKFENEVLKCWSKPLYLKRNENCKHDFGLLNMET
jgi:hypothetical protein